MSDPKNTEVVEVGTDSPTPVAAPAQNSPENLIAIAIQSKADIDTIERMMALRDKYEAKQAEMAFNEAMANFQAECPTIDKTKEAKDRNGVVLYKYAPIDGIIEAISPLLKRYGLSYSFKTDQKDNDAIIVTCVVTHKMGHKEETQLKVSTTGGTTIMSQPQKVAASLTFAKRYTLCNALGVVTGDEDIDGKTEDGTRQDAPTQEQMEMIDTLCSQQNITKAQFAQRVRAKYRVSVTQLTARQAQGIIEALSKTVTAA